MLTLRSSTKSVTPLRFWNSCPRTRPAASALVNLTNLVNRGEKLGAMSDDDYNLRRAEEHVAEARRLVLGQKGLIIRIRAAGIETSNAERILKVLERNLKTFEEHRDELKRRHADVGPSAADEADSAGSG
jgi:hypothetical protein